MRRAVALHAGCPGVAAVFIAHASLVMLLAWRGVAWRGGEPGTEWARYTRGCSCIIFVVDAHAVSPLVAALPLSHGSPPRYAHTLALHHVSSHALTLASLRCSRIDVPEGPNSASAEGVAQAT